MSMNFIYLLVLLGLGVSDSILGQVVSDPLPLAIPRKKGSYPTPYPSNLPSRKPVRIGISAKPSSKPTTAPLKRSRKPSSKVVVVTSSPSAPPKQTLLSPSSAPSNIRVRSYPTEKPSKRPSSFTYLKPSVRPSYSSNKPSTRPFNRITSKPSIVLVVTKLSNRPSIRLSAKPSLKTSSARISTNPSKRPSIRFSRKPSFKPSSMSLAIAVKPSKKPSSKYFYKSSFKPSNISKPLTARPIIASQSPSLRSNRPMVPPTLIVKLKSKAPISIEQSIKPVVSLRPSISFKYRTVRPSKSSIISLSSRAPTKIGKLKTVTPTVRDTPSPSNVPSHGPTITITNFPGSDAPPNNMTFFNASLPKFLLELYLGTSNAGDSRQLSTIATQAFSDSELTSIVTSTMLQGSSSEINANNISIATLSPSILTVNKTTSDSALVWITCKYSGFIYFLDNATISNQKLGQWILQIFGTSPSVDDFIGSLHAANNSYLQTVKSVKVRLLTDSSSSNVETMNVKRHVSRLPYAVIGSVLSFIILSVTAYFVHKKKRMNGYKSTGSIPSTPQLDLDMSPGNDEESVKQINGKKNTTLLGIEAKDVFIEQVPQENEYKNDNLSSICLSLTRILEERGMPPGDCDSQLTRTSLTTMIVGEEPATSTKEVLSWSLALNPESKLSYDENDARKCCVYNPMENQVARRLFDAALTSNPLYHEYIQHSPENEFTSKDTPLAQQTSLTLTPMPKKRSESFDMRNRHELSTPLEDEEEEEEEEEGKSRVVVMCGHSPLFPQMPSPNPVQVVKNQESSEEQPLSPRFTLDTKLSYEEYGVKNCCNVDSELKNRLFGNLSL